MWIKGLNVLLNKHGMNKNKKRLYAGSPRQALLSCGDIQGDKGKGFSSTPIISCMHFYHVFNTRDMHLLPKLHLNLVCTLACYSQLTFISNKYIVLHNILTTTNKLLKYVRFLKISYWKMSEVTLQNIIQCFFWNLMDQYISIEYTQKFFKWMKIFSILSKQSRINFFSIKYNIKSYFLSKWT